MRYALLIPLMLVLASPAGATLVEVPDDALVTGPGPGGAPDILQCATAPNPDDDTALFVWTVGDSIGANNVLAGIVDANVPVGTLLPVLDDTDAFVRDVDAAWDAGTGSWLVVWAQEDAPGAYEIYGRRVNSDGTIGLAPFRITTTGVDDLDPAFDALQPAAASNEFGTFLVTWAADDDAFGLADGAFDIFYRTVDARDESLGPVVKWSTFGSDGGAALNPDLGYLYSSQGWLIAYEGDSGVGPGDPYTPLIYAFMVYQNALPRGEFEPRLAIDVPARRATASWHNPSVAIDRLNQEVLLVWDQLDAGDAVARVIQGVRYDAYRNILALPVLRDLDVEGHGASSYVREPSVSHNRISGSYIVGWQESLNPANGTGRTLQVLEYDEASGITTPPFSFVNQGAVAPLPTEFGPPALEGGWRTNGRAFAIWVSDAGNKGMMSLWFQAFDLAAGVAAPPQVIPMEFAVRVAPNPFNPRTAVNLSLPVPGRAQVDIYDVRGRLVRKLVDEELPAGEYSRNWEGLDDRGQRVASGVYMVKVRHPGGERVTKVALVE